MSKNMNTNIKTWFALGFLLMSFLNLQAQSSYGRINGNLRDADTGEPLLYANVSLKNTALGAASDNAGYYLITNIPPGNYTLQVMIMGYERTEKEISIVAGLEQRFDFENNLFISA